jgi:hypothetical protein
MLEMVGDFETTTTPEDVRVWASCLVVIETGKLLHLSNDILETLEFLKKKKNTKIFYHNLKFDGEFWLSYLLSISFEYNEKLNSKNSFKTLITDSGAFYQIIYKFGKGINAHKITLLDSLKILPLPVKSLAKAFGLSIAKGEIDYTRERARGWVITEEEKEYIINDCKIVARCLNTMFTQGLEKMTMASNALGNYKSIIGKKEFNGLYPQLDMNYQGESAVLKTIDDFVRKSYKGGYTYVNEKFQNKDINCIGQTYDVNSLYPSRMYNELLPYDLPVYYKGTCPGNENYPLYIQHIKCKFNLKKGYIPILQIKGNCRFGETEYLKTSGVERVDLYLTNIDLELVKKHYNLTRVEYIDGYMFKAKKGLFKAYIDYWIEVKNKATIEGNKGMRQIAKLMLNSLYGKFAQSTNGALKMPLLYEGIVKMQLVEGEERNLVYTAMACYITAYARKVTITAFQDNVKRCCYCDTDSIHLVGEEVPNIDIDDVRLGAWKHESTWTFARFIRSKTYIEEIDGDLDVKCAGMPQNLKSLVTKDNFKIGLTLHGKKVPKRVKGGVILEDTDFTIK